MILDINAKSSSSLRHMILNPWRAHTGCQASSWECILWFLWLCQCAAGFVIEYRWSGPLSTLSAGCLSKQSVWAVLHMQSQAALQNTSQTDSNTTLIVLSRRSDLSLLISFCLSTSLHSFSLYEYDLLAQHVILFVSPRADMALCTVRLLFEQEVAIFSYFGSRGIMWLRAYTTGNFFEHVSVAWGLQ